MEAVNGSGSSLPSGVTATVTPGAGEVWAITSLLVGNSALWGSIWITTDGTTPASGGPGGIYGATTDAHAAGPSGPLVITDANPLKVHNGSGSTIGYNYSGMKL